MKYQNKSKVLLTVASLSLLGSGCSGGTAVCPGFGLPRAALWTTVKEVGSSATYRDSSGNTVVLVLREREDSLPYEGYDDLGSEHVACNMQSTRYYDLDDGQTAFKVTFSQSGVFEQPEDDPALYINLDVESPIGTALDYTFYLSDVRDPIARFGTDEFVQLYPDTIPRATRVQTNVQIGDVVYDLVIENLYTDPSYVSARAPDIATAIVRVIFAEGAGLVLFERIDGAVFTRVQ